MNKFKVNYELIATNNNGKIVYMVEDIPIIKEWLVENLLTDYRKIIIKRAGVK